MTSSRRLSDFDERTLASAALAVVLIAISEGSGTSLRHLPGTGRFSLDKSLPNFAER
jgi:hypothetical protein